MSDQIIAAYNQIAGLGEVLQSGQTILNHLQGDPLFHLAYAKELRLRHLRQVFAGRRPTRIFLSNNIRLLAAPVDGIECVALEKGFFTASLEARSPEHLAALDGAIVILNNNDAQEGGNSARYADLYRQCPNTFFIAWDWDNHHWLSLSYPFAAVSDLYCPSHYENLYQLSRFNAAIAVTPCATVQWTYDFLSTREDDVVQAQRQTSPLGRHIYYGGFRYRNQVVATLQPRFPDVGFTTHSFHDLTAEQKFAEWTQYRLHFIVPVLNDLPIRAFDAWITGGIPLMPESLRFSPVFADAHPNDLLFYSAADVIDPTDLVARANALFDQDGEIGIRRRHRYGMSHHHGASRVSAMLDAARKLLGGAW